MQYDDKSNKTLREMATAFEAAKENVTPVRRKALATLANGCRGQVLSSRYHGCLLIVDTGA